MGKAVRWTNNEAFESILAVKPQAHRGAGGWGWPWVSCIFFGVGAGHQGRCVLRGIESFWFGGLKRVLVVPVSYTHLRAHETDSYLVCRLLLEKKKKKKKK